MKVERKSSGFELFDDDGKSLGIFSSAAQAEQMKNLYAYQGQMQAMGKTGPAINPNAEPGQHVQEQPWVLKRFDDGSTLERDDDGVVRRYYPPPSYQAPSANVPAIASNYSATHDERPNLPPLPVTQANQPPPMPTPDRPAPKPAPQVENSALSPVEKRAKNEEMQARLATVGARSQATGDPNAGLDESSPLPQKSIRMSNMTGADWDLWKSRHLDDPWQGQQRNLASQEFYDAQKKEREGT